MFSKSHLLQRRQKASISGKGLIDCRQIYIITEKLRYMSFKQVILSNSQHWKIHILLNLQSRKISIFSSLLVVQYEPIYRSCNIIFRIYFTLYILSCSLYKPTIEPLYESSFYGKINPFPCVDTFENSLCTISPFATMFSHLILICLLFIKSYYIFADVTSNFSFCHKVFNCFQLLHLHL